MNVPTSAVLVLAALTSQDSGDDRFPVGRCGAASLSVCFALNSRPDSIESIDRSLGPLANQTSLLDLKQEAQRRGCWALALKTTNNRSVGLLKEAPAILPVVVHGKSHFIAAVASRSNDLLIVDFPRSPRWISTATLVDQFGWDGTMLHIGRDAAVQDRLRRLQNPFPYGWWFVGVAGLVTLPWLVQLASRSARRRSQRQQRRETSRGFSLLELVVCMAVLAIAVGLILPAIQSSRESARRIACTNNLHQIGVALHAFEGVNRRYPKGATIAVNNNDQEISRNISSHIELLPFLDQSVLSREFNRQEDGFGEDDEPPSSRLNDALLQKRVAAFECPSDAMKEPRNNYRMCAGTSTDIHEIQDGKSTPGLQGFRSLFGLRDSHLVDGKSTTVAFAERLAGDRNPGYYSPAADVVEANPPHDDWLTPDATRKACSHPVASDPEHFSFGGYTWALSGYACTWYNHVAEPNSRVPDCASGPSGAGMFSARSMHPGGVNVVFVDGATRFVSGSIDLRVWRALGTRAGHELIDSDF